LLRAMMLKDQTLRAWAGKWLAGQNFVFTCFIVAVVLRLLVVVVWPVQQTSDAAWYVGRAEELLAGVGYQEGGHPTAYWPVGWPAILALAFRVFDSPTVAVVALNLLGAAAIMAALLWFSRAVLEDELVGRLSIAAYAVYPGHIAYAGAAATETVYTAIAMLAFTLLIAKRNSLGWVAATGLAFGVATLIKPQTVLFPIGAVIAIALVYQGWGWRRLALSALVVYVALLSTVLPWSIRNYVTFDKFVLVSTNGGAALLLGASDYTTGDDFSLQRSPLWEKLGIPWEQRVQRQIELGERMKNLAVQWIRENPTEYAAWMPKKVVLLWLKDTDGFWTYEASYPESKSVVRGFQYLNQIYYGVIVLLSAVAAAAALRAWIRTGTAPPTALLFCMPIFVTLLAAVFTGQIRYHFPAMPFLVMAAAWTLVGVKPRSTRSAIVN